MTISLGVLAALVAFLGWGFGDFAIQRAVRRVGNLETLFAIGALGFVLILPFVWSGLPDLLHNVRALEYLGITIVVTLIAALLDFEGLKQGKISIVEPVMSLELVLVIAISVVFLGERMTFEQGILSLFVFIGILLTVLRNEPRQWWQRLRGQRILEKGVSFTLAGTFFLSFSSIFTALASRETDALTTIWVVHTLLALICFIWFCVGRRLHDVLQRINHSRRTVFVQSVLDNTAWIAYAEAVRVIPISLTIGITESYIALSSLLGIFWNRERPQRHQYVGMALAIIAAIVLAVITA